MTLLTLVDGLGERAGGGAEVPVQRRIVDALRCSGMSQLVHSGREAPGEMGNTVSLCYASSP
jgi:hypothetical protein